MKKVLINVEERELRVAMLEDDQLVELYIESLDEKSILNNIYKGRVEDVLPGLKAAFVNIGLDRNAFLHFDDVRPDLIWGKYRELNPELADEVPTAREALAEASLEPEEDGDEESADGKRKRRRGRRGGKKRRPDAEDSYSPGLPVGVTEDDLEDDDDDDHDHDTQPIAASSTPPEPYADDRPAALPQRYERPAYNPPAQVTAPSDDYQADDQPGTSEPATDETQPSHTTPAAASTGIAGPVEDEIERRRIARIEKQRQRRDRWEQKKQERHQRRQQERLERGAPSGISTDAEAPRPVAAAPATPAAAPAYIAPEPVAPAVYGTRGAAHSADNYSTFSVGNQRRSAKQRYADQARYGDNFGNIAVRKNERVDHRESQADFFGPNVSQQDEQHSIWDDKQPNLGPVPAGRLVFGDEMRRPARNNERYGSERRQGAHQVQNKVRKFNKDNNNNNNNKRRGGKKRTTMRKRDNRSYFSFSADDIIDNVETTNTPADNLVAEKKPVRKRKAAADSDATPAPKKAAAKKPTTRKAPATRKKAETDEPIKIDATQTPSPALVKEQTDAFTELVTPKKTRAPRKPATRKKSETVKSDATAQPATEPANLPEPLNQAPVQESPVPSYTQSQDRETVTQDNAQPHAVQQPADQTAPVDTAPSDNANTDPQAQPNGEPQRRVRETRSQRFSRIRRERAIARAEARAARAESEGTASPTDTPASSPAETTAETPTPAATPTPAPAPSEREARPSRRDRDSRKSRGDRPQRNNFDRTNGAAHTTPDNHDSPVATEEAPKPAPYSNIRPPRRDARPKIRRPQFQEVFKKGDELIVQVVKEEIGMKGARISSYVSLPGRYLVLLPYPNQEGGISRKVEDIKERKRLKNLLQDISSDETAFIIRTAGVFQEEKEIRKDVEFLSSEWATIADRYKKADASALVYDDHDIIYRLARDVFDDSVGEILIDSFTEFEKLKSILTKLIPNLVDKVKLYSGAENMFHKFGVTKQIQKAARRKVWLKSGGYLIIDEAEALTAIDVNTGKSVGKDDQEKLILRTNIESARAVARELKLRDIGGLIVIDFIDMKDPRNREQVLHELKLQLRKDRSKTSVSAISEFGLVEMTRKRVRRSLRKTLFMDCPYCQGAGVVLNEQQIWLHIKHELVRQLESQRPAPSINITVNPRIRAYIDQNYKDVIRRLEQKYDTEVKVSMSDIFHIENYQIDKADTVGVISGSATMPSR